MKAIYLSLTLSFGLIFIAPQARSSCNDMVSHFEIYNPSSQLPFESYGQLNDRPLSAYDDILLRFRPNGPTSLTEVVPHRGTIVDGGGGRGVAMKQLAGEKDVLAFVINTQEIPYNERFKKINPGDWVYEVGFAEDVLPRLPMYNVYVDVFGAFTYSTEKVALIELIWGGIIPGGEAFIYFNNFKAPAVVELRRGGTLPLHKWLKENRPEFFDYWTAGDGNGQTSFASIIHIRKPVSGAPKELQLPLQTVDRQVLSDTPAKFPAVKIRETGP